MFAETNPCCFLITVSVASTSTSTKRCWHSGRTMKTLIRVTTSLSLAIVTTRYLPELFGVLAHLKVVRTEPATTVGDVRFVPLRTKECRRRMYAGRNRATG